MLASDFHLKPEQPEGIALFCAFVRDVVRGAERFYVLGDLFETWVGRSNLKVAGYEPVFEALADVARAGTEVVLFHGNRDFLLGATEAARAGGRVVGEELAVELYGRRYLLLHGDSLCTLDVGYQRSKRVLRSPLTRFLAVVLPYAAAHKIAFGLRRTSKRTTAAKSVETMELTREGVAARFRESYAALVCGHVHRPGLRDYGAPGRPLPVYVLGDWHGGGVYGVIDAEGVRLERYGG